MSREPRPMFEGEIVFVLDTKNHFFREGLSVRLLAEDTNRELPEIVGLSPFGTSQWLKYCDFRQFYDED